MRPDTIDRLLAINATFYQTFAADFSATRQRLQPGVTRILQRLPRQARILELGCGNGTLWEALSRRGHQGSYVGIDASGKLIGYAKELPGGRFEQRDISKPGWEQGLPGPFDFVLAFALLHHLPAPLHTPLLQVLRRLLDRQADPTPPGPGHAEPLPAGTFIHSNWQFLHSDRLRARIVPWSQAGIDQEAVDASDYLVDWRRGGQGFRYVHHFSQAELQALAHETGFLIMESFLSDGKEGNLALYQIWR